MSNISRICWVFLFITLWLTEAYSGKRIRTHEKSGFQIKDHYEDELHNYAENPLKDKDVNVNLVKTPIKPAVNDEHHTEKGESWVDLGITFSKLAKPYLPEKIYQVNLDWNEVEVALRSFESFTTSGKNSERSGTSPLEVTIRAAAAAASPMIMDGVRILLGNMLDLIDNTAFVTNGHAISKRGLSEDVLDDVMEVFTAILEHFTGGMRRYRDAEDL